MRMPETVIFANMCMICDQSGNVLVQDRRDPKWSGITFPGGHVEAGESFTDALVREIREETGLIIFEPRLCGIKDWIEETGLRYVVHFYRADRFEGSLCASDEGEVLWVPLSNLPNLNLANGMDLMLRVFCEDRISEMYFCKTQKDWKPVLK